MLYKVTADQPPVKVFEFDPGTINRVAVLRGDYVHHMGANAVHTFDISDLDNIHQINSWSAPGEARFIEYYNNHLYITGYYNALSVLDIHEPENPQLTYLDPSYQWYRSLYAHNDMLFVGDTRALFYYDLTNPAQPQLMDTLWHRGDVEKMEMHGQYLFGFNDHYYENNFFILDLADINNPILVNELDMGSIEDMKIVDDKLYLFTNSYFKVYDISDLTNLVLTYTSNFFLHSRNLAYRDGYVYLLEGSGSPWTRIRVMDVSDPYNVRPLTTLEIVADLELMFIEDNWLYIGKKNDGIQIYDLTRPAHPELCGYFEAPGMIWNFDLNEHDFYISLRNTILFGRFDQLLDLEQNHFIPATERLHVYPNPATEYLCFELPQAEKAYTYHIFDLAGKLLEQGRLNSGTQQLELRNLSEGMYLIEVWTTEASRKKALFMKQ